MTVGPMFVDIYEITWDTIG